MSQASELLGPDGPFAAHLTDYEVRDGQLTMAASVEQALAQERVLFCEAGTGTGKTLAYLIPAVLSGQKIIVSTATRALQAQLFFKDIPLVEELLGRRVSAALLKGLGNYLCIRRFEDLRRSDSGSGNAENRRKLRTLGTWRRQTGAGDVAELDDFSENDALLGLVTASSDTRLGSKCPHYEECFITRAKRDAEAAQIVVVNHHLFFADLALRGPHPGRVLPNYDAVIFDEAHRIEDVATLFFGIRVSLSSIRKLCGDATRELSQLGRLSSSLPDRVEATGRALFDQLAEPTSQQEKRRRLEPDEWVGARQSAYLDLDAALETLQSTADAELNATEERSERVEAICRRAGALRDQLATIVEGAPGRVTWLDREKSPALSSSPVELTSILAPRLFDEIPTVVLTSATLTTGNNPASAFNFIKQRLGASESEREIDELIVPSPFDFTNHALLYLANDLPEPSSPGFIASASERMIELIEASDGGALVLTTSLRSMSAVYRILAARLEDRVVLVQGSQPKHALLDLFKSHGSAVLVATSSFWEGIDIPGSALRLVILEKVPFPSPADPLIRARAEALETEGQNPFNALFVPLAQMTLKQGFGRLIRTRRDRGVVAILDKRIHSKAYGPRLLAGLPPARQTTCREEARRFLEQAGSS